MNVQPIVILDLDNCIADDAHRIPHIDWSQRDPDLRYAPYHSRLSSDGPPCNRHAWTQPGVRNFIFTARPEAYREVTRAWLRKHGVPCAVLLMRPEGDHCPSVALKSRMLDVVANTHPGVPLGGLIRAAYDDRRDVIEMYRSRGVLAAEQLWIHEVCAYTPPPTTRKEN